MKPSIFLTLCASLVAGIAPVSAAEPSPITLESMLTEMTSRDAVAKWPSPTYTCKQFSSYDRASTSAEKQDTWYSNYDFTQFLRVEKVEDRFEHVMFDAKGPGAVVRFWGTVGNPTFHEGILRVYLDGSDTPAIEAQNGKLLSGGALVGAPLSSSSAPETIHWKRGHNLYLPIPYAKSCKITYQLPSGEELTMDSKYYYNINYRTYEPGTKVESFSMDGLKAAQAKVDQTQSTLEESPANNDVTATDTSLSGALQPGASRSVTLAAKDGGGAIRGLTFKLSAENRPQALRSTILEISFDGKRTVWCPLGDFMGTGYQVRPTKFWYGSVSEDGLMQSHWVMPYEKSAKVTLRNLGEQTVDVETAAIKSGDWTWNERSMHFGVSWHQMSEVKSGAAPGMTGRGAYDMNYVTLEGQGVYVGDTLTLFDGHEYWWGEGDEKIYVDGETFPSHFGTGTEDYYGYAWCLGAKFQTPFITQPDGTGDMGIGYVVNGRYRLLDGIPFTQSIKVDMEQHHHAATLMDIAPTTYWYARPGGRSNQQPDIEGATHPVAIEVADLFPQPVLDADGAIEGESMIVVSASGGNTEFQSLTDNWSGGAQLWWRNGKEGDVLKLRFDAKKKWAGQRKLTFRLTQAADYGKVSLTLNGKVIAPTVDGFDPVLKVKEFTVEKATLQEGANDLEIKLIGTNKDARPGMMFGLDQMQAK